jgi:DNA-binding response OmpR family regulator
MDIYISDLSYEITEEELHEREKVKVLIIDDDMNIQRLFREELEEEGYEVFTAGTGRKALFLLEMESPDIVSLDILMPDIDGRSLLRQIKKQSPDTPVIMTSAYDYRDDFKVLTSEAYVVKSSDLKELKGTIINLLQSRQKEQKPSN